VQLAQLNIAEALYPVEDSRMDGFTGPVEQINALADRSSGFVWRLTDDGDTDGALSLRMEGMNDYTLVNMSVWADIESLFHFIYKTAHAKVMRGKDGAVITWCSGGSKTVIFHLWTKPKPNSTLSGQMALHQKRLTLIRPLIWRVDPSKRTSRKRIVPDAN